MKQVASQLLAFSLFILLSIQLQSCNQRDQNQHLSDNAGLLLQYIHEISGKYTLTGQHNYLSQLSMAPDSIFQLTGKYPAIWGGDFGFSGIPNDTDDIALRPRLMEEIKEQHELGSIITITYHQASPTIGEPCSFENGVQVDISDSDWEAILDPGTELYGEWRKQMDHLHFSWKASVHWRVQRNSLRICIGGSSPVDLVYGLGCACFSNELIGQIKGDLPVGPIYHQG
jgi:hypothetical protein